MYVYVKRSTLNYAINIANYIVQIIFKLFKCEDGKYAFTFLLRLKLNFYILTVRVIGKCS